MSLQAKLALLTCITLAITAAHDSRRGASAAEERREKPVSSKEDASPCVWLGAAGRVCYANVRSRDIALAREQGLNEHGGALDEAARKSLIGEMETWLRRLEGSYRIVGTYRNRGGSSSVQGTAQCLGFGGGPAISCLITATWKAPKESYKDKSFDRGISEAMQPLVLRFGMDPDRLQIRAALMDQRALKIKGYLIDDAVAFSSESKGEHDTDNPLVPYAWDSTLVAINPDGGVQMRFTVVPTSTESKLAELRKSMGHLAHAPGVELDLRLAREPRNAADPLPTWP